MKIDMRLITGVLVGVVLGLHMIDTLMVYLPLLTVVTFILVLKNIVHH